MLAEAGEHFHHARIELALVRRQLGPFLNIGVVTRKLRVLGHDAQLFLSSECVLAINVPALVELAFVFVRPFLRNMMGRVVRARREIKEKRFVRRDLLQIGDEVDRLVGKIGSEMITLFRRLRRLDLMIVINKVGIILMRVTAEETVIALKATPERPAIIRTGRADLLGRREMPFADAIGCVTLLQKHLGQKAVLKRNRAIAARKARRALGDAGHGVRMMIAAGQHAGTRRRTERGRVHVVEQEAILRELVDVRRRDRRAVAAELAKSGVVDDDEEHVRRPRFGATRRGPCGLGFADRAAHAAGKCRAGLIFLERHFACPSPI